MNYLTLLQGDSLRDDVDFLLSDFAVENTLLAHRFNFLTLAQILISLTFNFSVFNGRSLFAAKRLDGVL
jgi:hypothetical protein